MTEERTESAAPEAAAPPESVAQTIPTRIPPTPIPVLGEPREFSSAQPVWQFVLLSVCSFGLYHLVWFYRNWHLLKAHRHLRVTPLLRTIFAPIFVFSFYRSLFEITRPERDRSLGTVYAAGYFFTNLLSYVLGQLTGRHSLESILSLLTILILVLCIVNALCLVPAVRALNSFWEQQQPGLPMRRRLSGGAWVVIILGGLFWLLVLSSIA